MNERDRFLKGCIHVGAAFAVGACAWMLVLVVVRALGGLQGEIGADQLQLDAGVAAVGGAVNAILAIAVSRFRRKPNVYYAANISFYCLLSVVYLVLTGLVGVSGLPNSWALSVGMVFIGFAVASAMVYFNRRQLGE